MLFKKGDLKKQHFPSVKEVRVVLSQHQGHQPDPLAFFSPQWRRLDNDTNTYQYHFNVIDSWRDASVDLNNLQL